MSIPETIQRIFRQRLSTDLYAPNFRSTCRETLARDDNEWSRKTEEGLGVSHQTSTEALSEKSACCGYAALKGPRNDH
jgi:hypothetical protein